MSKYSCFKIFATTLINFSEFNACKLYKCQQVFSGIFSSGLRFLAMVAPSPESAENLDYQIAYLIYRQFIRLLKSLTSLPNLPDILQISFPHTVQRFNIAKPELSYYQSMS